MNKYSKPTLPKNAEEADSMADLREAWAKEAREADKHGSAWEFDLTALLLRNYAFFERVAEELKERVDRKVIEDVLNDTKGD